MADDVLISQIPDAALALSGTDFVEIEQISTPTNLSGKTTLAALLAYIEGNLTPITIVYPVSLTIALSDLTTALVSGATVVGGWVADYNGAITAAMISVVMAQSSSGAVTVDCKKNGVSIFTTKPSIDALENSSLTGTQAVLVTNPVTFVAGDKFTFTIDTAGTGAKGLQITLKGIR
jgi:hypothetical protein